MPMPDSVMSPLMGFETDFVQSPLIVSEAVVDIDHAEKVTIAQLLLGIYQAKAYEAIPENLPLVNLLSSLLSISVDESRVIMSKDAQLRDFMDIRYEYQPIRENKTASSMSKVNVERRMKSQFWMDILIPMLNRKKISFYECLDSLANLDDGRSILYFVSSSLFYIIN
jgi:hypothetical protein